MNKGKIMKTFMKWGGVVYTLALMSIVGNAQTIDSTLALKMACETSPGNTVNINSPTAIRINTGASGKCLSDQNTLTAPIVQACQ